MAHAGGRPTALTPEVLEHVRRLLPTCLYLETVADFLGLDRSTVRKWLKRGAQEHRRVSTNRRARFRKREALYVELFVTFRKALAEGLIYDLGIIKKASADQVVSDESGRPVSIRPGQWKAAAAVRSGDAGRRDGRRSCPPWAGSYGSVRSWARRPTDEACGRGDNRWPGNRRRRR